ncbi:MAG: FAD-dependent oxidoreductase [Micromonosporaceae bacterium]
MSRTRTALVIGGGIGGPVAAMALQRAGIGATVYEAYRSSADGIGGELSIAPNGQHALAAIGADAAVRGIGVPMRAIVVESWTGKRLGELGTAAGRPPMQLVWRPELYRALYDEAARRGIRTLHGKQLVAAEDTGDGVLARFADGSTATADILIGADGIRSTVRTLIDPGVPQPRYTGLLGFGARMPETGMAYTRDRMHMSFGKRAFFGWQVHRDGSGGWFANLPRRQPMTLAEARAVDTHEWQRLLLAAFAGDRTPAVDMIRRAGPGELLAIGAMEDIPTVPTWSRGRMVLVGDAAHATSPSSGQGASPAIESAVELARCLRDLPHDQAFRAYEGLRRERVEKIIARAARTNSDKAAGPVARVLRDAMMPLVMKLFMTPERFAAQFDYHIDWDAPVTPQPVPVG